jgi:hypothetical protein
VATVAGPARADERKGLILGLNAGSGGAAVSYEDDTRSIFEDAEHGGFGGLRFGYSFSKSFALTLEGFGVGSFEDEPDDWGLGAGFLVATWHPGGSGFFVRLGVGGGGGDFLHPDTGEKITITDRAAGLLGLGYDWFIGENTSLGLAVDGMGIDAGGATGYDEDAVGIGGFSIQMNFYL